MRSEIGSEFEEPSLPDAEATQRPISPMGACLVGSGRDALTLVAEDLVRGGIDRVVFPNHYCESMVTPFRRNGLQVEFLPSTAELILDGRSLANKLDSTRAPFAILHNEIFGTPADKPLSEALNLARKIQCPVIVDETHSLLSGRRATGDYHVASLRKLLPVPDGGYAAGIKEPSSLARTSAHAKFVELRIKAARAKSNYLAGRRDDKFHLELFTLAESILETEVFPSRISTESLRYLDRLDIAKIKFRRSSNARKLAANLDRLDITIVNGRGWKNSPAYVAISHPDVPGLRSHLASHKIFCPIHWPRPSDLPVESPWRDDLLSLPVDHRYALEDMDRIAETISQLLKRRTK